MPWHFCFSPFICVCATFPFISISSHLSIFKKNLLHPSSALRFTSTQSLTPANALIFYLHVILQTPEVCWFGKQRNLSYDGRASLIFMWEMSL